LQCGTKSDDQQAARGVITHSSGNHAQALALAAKMRGIPAHVIMPSNASPVKRRAVEEYGGQIVFCEPTLEARETVTGSVQAQTGAYLIPPYNHPDVIAGQGTVALELLQQIQNLDAIVMPVGGGGLMAGISIAAKTIQPALRIFAAEPCGANDAAQSKAAGTLIPQTNPRTIADGLLTSLGDLTWPLLRDQVEKVITVSESDIFAAMRLAWERAKWLIEPSSAVAVAAVLTEEFRALPGLSRVGVILSGGNVNMESVLPLFSKG